MTDTQRPEDEIRRYINDRRPNHRPTQVQACVALDALTTRLEQAEGRVETVDDIERELEEVSARLEQAEAEPPKDGRHYAWVEGIGWCPGDHPESACGHTKDKTP
jgi:transcription elongation GreA/GreB family factor